MSASTLTGRDRRSLISLIGKLQSHLESVVQSNVLPSTGKAMRGYVRETNSARRDWRTAEEWVKRLEVGR